MNIKTSITIITGCLVIFLFVMLPIFLSIEKREDEFVKKFRGSSFSLNDVNNDIITESSFEGPLTAIFFFFTGISLISLNKFVMKKMIKNVLSLETSG